MARPSKTSKQFHPLDNKARKTGVRQRTVIQLENGQRCRWTFLPSGAQILLVLDSRRRNSVQTTFFVRGGAREDSIPGITHAVEHLVSRGGFTLERMPKNSPLRNLAGNVAAGYEFGAWTAPGVTYYSGMTSTKHWRKLVAGMLDVVMKPERFTVADWEQERRAVIQEDRQNGQLTPASREIQARLFPDDPFLRRAHPHGSDEDIQGYTIEDLQAHHARTHQPQNLCILLDGVPKKDRAKAERLCEALLERIITSGDTLPRIEVYMPRGARPTNERITLNIPKAQEQLLFISPLFLKRLNGVSRRKSALLLMELARWRLLEELRFSGEGNIYGVGIDIEQTGKHEFFFSVFMKTPSRDIPTLKLRIPEIWNRLCEELAAPARTPATEQPLLKTIGCRGLRWDDGCINEEPLVQAIKWIWLAQRDPKPPPPSLADYSAQALMDELPRMRTYLASPTAWDVIEIVSSD